MSLCHHISRFTRQVEPKDEHQYHLVRTAADKVALHRYAPEIGCIRTAWFRWIPEVIKAPSPEDASTWCSPWHIHCKKLGTNDVDIESIKHWLSICSLSHINCRLQGSRDLPRSMKLIDCWDRSIVPCKPGMTFAALSYTWGTAVEPDPLQQWDFMDHESITHLPSDLPKTVEDAIDLVRRLDFSGMRYLWVDRYCIDQHHAEEKHEQIQQMHDIYSNAHVTIIAAAGESADSGLPGLGLTPRRPQSYVATSDGALVSVEANTDVITQSAWMKRGWTFQEACFSRRRLFFTPEQVTFECAKMTAQEVLKMPLRYGTPGCTLKPLFGLHLSNVSGEETRPFSYFIEEYSRRMLTYESDALSAFSGILHALEQGKQRLYHLWAIEIKLCVGSTCRTTGRQSHCTCPPAMSLLWDHKQGYDLSYRRHDYPSWSWLGWQGPVTFSRLKAATGITAKIWAERWDGTLQVLDCESDAKDFTENLSSYSRYIHVRACTFDVKVYPEEDTAVIQCGDSTGAKYSTEIKRGNTSLMNGQLSGETFQAIMLNRHASFGWRSTRIPTTLLLVKKNDGHTSFRVGVCEVEWYPFGYLAETLGEVMTTRIG